ncbi:MAG: protoporphyrinogen oxidase HemJ [Xanthomonadales bacterium]|nr:protoporphyrinogen oxidase HemJ [Xanthomonadales bacterium]ODU94979.1 MAG: TIGR00701 family protein [Rhodanobacter sp. SCN 66-43]OJY82275.1 MAG: TIGR00701 family protein [Xanthomonadales bacterium 66-474]
MLPLWLKAFHIMGVVTWFAGLFYLPRLFVYHAEATEPAIRERFKVMERRLLVMTHIGGALAIAFGIATLASEPFYLRAGWLHVKLALVLLLVVYHGMLVKLAGDFARDRCRWTSRGLRGFNEIPGVLLLAIVILAVVKPF